jgi:ribonucleoside-diphosphate reductase subunit M1
MFFSVKIMYNHFNHRSGKKAPLIADDVYEIIIKVLDMVNCMKFEMIFYRFWGFDVIIVKFIYFLFWVWFLI